MGLPKQVQAQVEQAAQIEQQLAAERAAQQPPPEGAEAPPDTPPVAVETPPEPTAPPVTTAQPTSPPVVEQKPVDGLWEQKYRTLQGMFSRETQQLREQLLTVNQQLATVMKERQEREAPKPSPLVTEKDVEAFGGDLIDMARRVAREEFGTREQAYVDKIAQLEAQVQKQFGDVQQSQQASSREIFFSKLTQAVPTWRELEQTDAAQQWLASRVPGASFTWNDVLVNAAQRFDSDAAIEVFNTFSATQPRAAEPQPASRARSELSRQVTPQKSNAAPPVSAAKRNYNSADYEAESMRIIRLSKQGKFDEAAAIEQELNAALQEGRVRP